MVSDESDLKFEFIFYIIWFSEFKRRKEVVVTHISLDLAESGTHHTGLR